MARTRLIKPEFFKHGDLFDAERSSGLPLRIAFAGLWCQADREGRFVWKPRELKLDVLPYDDVDFAAVLVALERAGFVVRYEVDGKTYGLIPSFPSHQSFHKTERPSTLPPPPDNGGAPVNEPLEHREAPGANTAVTVTVTGTVAGTDKMTPARRRASADAVSDDPDFDAMWGAWPPDYRGSKREARDQWDRRKRGGYTAAIIRAGADRYLAQCKALDRFAKNVSTFLGPKLHFLEEWPLPANARRPSGEGEGPRTLRATEQLIVLPRSA